jgi:hypothetical protein
MILRSFSPPFLPRTCRAVLLAAALATLLFAKAGLAQTNVCTYVGPNATSQITGPDGVCYKVTNNNGSNSRCIPTLTTAMWQSFYNHPGAATLATCQCAAGTASWGTYCSAPVGALNYGANTGVTNTASGYTGSATVTCSSGSYSYSGTSCTVADPCAGSPSVGTTCADGTIYAGYDTVNATPLYTTPCDQGMVGTHASCTGTRTTYEWGTYGTTTGCNNTTNGVTDKNCLLPTYASYNDGYVTGVPAEQACTNLNANGHTDWFLPSSGELNILCNGNNYNTNGGSQTGSCPNAATVGGFDTSGNWYWSSSEYGSNTHAWVERISDGWEGHNAIKNNGDFVRCVRR